MKEQLLTCDRCGEEFLGTLHHLVNTKAEELIAKRGLRGIAYREGITLAEAEQRDRAADPLIWAYIESVRVDSREYAWCPLCLECEEEIDFVRYELPEIVERFNKKQRGSIQ